MLCNNKYTDIMRMYNGLTGKDKTQNRNAEPEYGTGTRNPNTEPERGTGMQNTEPECGTGIKDKTWK